MSFFIEITLTSVITFKLYKKIYEIVEPYFSGEYFLRSSDVVIILGLTDTLTAWFAGRRMYSEEVWGISDGVCSIIWIKIHKWIVIAIYSYNIP